MNSDQIKTLLDCCFVAKHITEEMKELPKGFKPRHMHVLAAVAKLSASKHDVRVSDVSRALNITTPSVTKLINDLCEKAVMEKYTHDKDKREALVRLTALGEEYEYKYVEQYHTEWADNLGNISDEEIETAVRVIHQLADAMPKGDLHEK